VVDEDADSRHSLRKALRDSGMLSSSARSGAEAIAKLERALVADLCYQLVFFDAALFEGDGLEAAEWMRTKPEFAEIEIIPITSLSRPQDWGRCRQVGLTTALVKPVLRAEVLELVRAILEAREGTRPKSKRASTACLLRPGHLTSREQPESRAHDRNTSGSLCVDQDGIRKH
jgi:CheY-like chemotaxis protein